MLRGEVWQGPDARAAAEEAARRFVRAAREAIAARGRFHVALAGGTTPRMTYQLLARGPAAGLDEVDWSRVTAFFGDERCVPPDDPRSNFRMAREALLAGVPATVRRIRGELPPDEAARDYEAVLRGEGPPIEPGAAASGGAFPCFDLVLLGMGPEGHTASLFPHQPALAERRALYVATRVPAEPPDRVTMTLPLINAARLVMITISGAEKAAVLKAAREAPPDPGPLADEHPVLHVRAARMVWVLGGL